MVDLQKLETKVHIWISAAEAQIKADGPQKFKEVEIHRAEVFQSYLSQKDRTQAENDASLIEAELVTLGSDEDENTDNGTKSDNKARRTRLQQALDDLARFF